MMQAAVLQAPGKISVEQVPVPQPGAGEVRVRIEGVDRASGAITAAGVDWPHSSR